MSAHLSPDELTLMATQQLDGDRYDHAVRHLGLCADCRAAVKQQIVAMELPERGRGMQVEDLGGRPRLLVRLKSATGGILQALRGSATIEELHTHDPEVERLPLFPSPSGIEHRRGTLAAAPPRPADDIPDPLRTGDGRIVIRFLPRVEGEDLEAAMVARIEEMGAGAALVFPELDLAFPVDPDGRIRLEGCRVFPDSSVELWRLPSPRASTGDASGRPLHPQ